MPKLLLLIVCTLANAVFSAFDTHLVAGTQAHTAVSIGAEPKTVTTVMSNTTIHGADEEYACEALALDDQVECSVLCSSVEEYMTCESRIFCALNSSETVRDMCDKLLRQLPQFVSCTCGYPCDRPCELASGASRIVMVLAIALVGVILCVVLVAVALFCFSGPSRMDAKDNRTEAAALV